MKRYMMAILRSSEADASKRRQLWNSLMSQDRRIATTDRRSTPRWPNVGRREGDAAAYWESVYNRETRNGRAA